MAENSGQDTGLPTDFEEQRVPPQLGPIIKFGAVIVGLVLLFALFLVGLNSDAGRRFVVIADKGNKRGR